MTLMIMLIFHDFPGLENGVPKFQDFPGPEVTLTDSKGIWPVILTGTGKSGFAWKTTAKMVCISEDQCMPVAIYWYKFLV